MNSFFQLFLVSAAKKTKNWVRSKALICLFLIAHSFFLLRPLETLLRRQLLWVNCSALGVYLGLFQLYHLAVNLQTPGRLLQIIVSLVKVR